MIPHKEEDWPGVSNGESIAKAGSLPTLSADELYVRSSAVVSRVVAGEMLVLPVRHNVGDLTSLFSFNGTGSTIWNALETPRTLQELCDVIDRKYDLSREKAEEDVRIFVRELCSLGLAKALVDPENTSANGNRFRKIPTAPE